MERCGAGREADETDRQAPRTRVVLPNARRRESRHMIPTRHLFTIAIEVPCVVDLGATPSGRRRIATVGGGTFNGDRLNGTIQPSPGGGRARRA